MLVHEPSPPDDRADLFHSKFALSKPPFPLAREATVLYMALSMWDETGFDKLETLALNPAAPQFRAAVRLKPKIKGHLTGICIADTDVQGHWSVWGTPTKLGACLVDIQPVGSRP